MPSLAALGSLPTNREHGPVKIDIAPFKAEQLTPSEARVQSEEYHGLQVINKPSLSQTRELLVAIPATPFVCSRASLANVLLPIIEGGEQSGLFTFAQVSDPITTVYFLQSDFSQRMLFQEAPLDTP